MKVTYFGHSCLLVEVAGFKLLFDPFIAGNPLTVGLVDVASIEADFVLLSHGHADHVADAKAILDRTGAMLISNYEIVTWFAAQGCTHGHPMNHGGSFDFPFGRVKYVSAIHSSMLPDGSYGGNPGGFVVETAEGAFYFSGDTALTYDMQLIGADHTIAWAAICLGDNFTMGPRDAVKCATWVGTKQVLGIHFDTFPPIAIDHAAAKNLFADAGIALHLLPVAGTFVPAPSA